MYDNEQPVEEPKRGESREEVEQASPPLYEFPAESIISPPVPDSALTPQKVSEKNTVSQPSDEAVRQGLIYPPPPSYYQNMQVPIQRPPLPTKSAKQPVSDVYALGSQRQPSPLVGQPFPPVAPYPAPPKKRETKWIWILIAVVSACVLISCGLCSWAFLSVFNVTYERVTDASSVVDDFYHSIQRKDYSAAYSYLAPEGSINGLTQSDFIQRARQRETNYGAVLSYTPQQPSFGSDPTIGLDLTHIIFPVQVVRDKQSYTASLTVSKVNGSWKITDFDQI